MKTKNKYYSIKNILAKNADYNIIFGERSNGKTYALLAYALKRFVETGEQTAYVRRWREDIHAKRAAVLFANHVANGYISELTGGKFDSVTFKTGRYYLTNTSEETTQETPFCFIFCLSDMEHDKSTSYPYVTTIIFDEFLTRRYYLPDEFMLFMNLISTIIRQRDNVKIFMLGNTVNKYCPYFSEMGLRNVATMKQGTIDIYQFGKGGAVVAVEYTAPTAQKKESNKYFCFDNQNLKMITGGKWELAIYPHLPVKYKPSDVVFMYFIEWQDTILQANIICNGVDNFTYIHPKTTPIHETESTLIYRLEQDGKPNHKRRILSNVTELDRKISQYFVMDKVFYSSNEIGEIVRNYIQVSQKSNLI